jgi:hypothetical protein
VKRTATDKAIMRNLLAIFSSMLLMGVLSLATSYYTVRYFEHQWCDTLTTLVDGYTEPASTPPSERSKRLAADLIELRRRYGC